MKKIAFLLFVILLSACNRPPAGEQKAAPGIVENQIIDRPAVVLVAPQPKQSVLLEPARRLLNPYGLPIISSCAGNLEFIKNNGDRVELALSALSPRYDLILFTGSRDPLPLRMSELRAALHTFYLEARNASPPLNAVSSVNPSPDTITPFRFSDQVVSEMRPGDRTVVIYKVDTDTSRFLPRNLPNIRWVEQRVDTRKILYITFENDLITYANTDRYFTNGITISLQAPWLGNTKLAGLALPYRKTSNVSYSVDMVQNMYTPTDTRVEPRLHDDRPYSSYLYLGFRKTQLDPLRKLKISSHMLVGYLGPYSPGSYLQTLVHETFPTNDRPRGWETQLKTDVLLNYKVAVEKALISKENLLLNATAQVQAGTLYDNAGGGIRLQAGNFEPYFGTSNGLHRQKWQYYFFLEGNLNLVAYDATLQGGMFSNDNVFLLKASEVSHLAGNSCAGFRLVYKDTGLEIAQHYLSPEYKGGLSHKWGRISLLFRL